MVQQSRFSTYLSGLRSRLDKYSVNVITIIPGFVNTNDNKCAITKIYKLIITKVAKKIFKAYKLKLSYSYVSIFWGLFSKVLKMMQSLSLRKSNFK